MNENLYTRSMLVICAITLIGIVPTYGLAAVEKSLDRALDVLAQEVTESLPQDKKPLLAVLDFSDLSDCVTAFGRMTSEELITKLFRTKRARVVERGLLKKALEELKFNMSEIVDPNRAKQLGKQVGADAIVTGTITDLGNSIKVNARVIEVERGDVLGAAGSEVAKDESIARLVSQTLTCPSGPKPLIAGSSHMAAVTPRIDPKVKKEWMFENSYLRVTARTVKKQAKTAFLVITYENLGDRPYKMIYQNDGTYLLDEEGNRWNFRSDSATVLNWVELVPKTKLQNRITFEATGASEGQVFTIVSGLSFQTMWVDGRNWPPDFQTTVTINDIHGE